MKKIIKTYFTFWFFCDIILTYSYAVLTKNGVDLMSERINVRGVRFDNVNAEETMDKIKAFLEEDGVSVMYTPNSEIVQFCIDDNSLFEVINSAQLIIPDGIGVIYASKILKTPLKARVPGIETAERVVEYASKTGKSIFILGGAKATETCEAVSKIAADKLCKKYPGLVVAGTCDGFFTQEQSVQIVDEINASGASILFVCLGAPKQEKWIYDNRDKLKVRFAAGLGGSVNIFAGTAQRAPEFFINHNIEWLHRLLKEPSRIGRMMNLPRFLLGTIIHRNKGLEG